MPEQFGKLTVEEFNDLLDGWKWRHETQRRLIAWQTAYLLNCWSKRKTTPEKLLNARRRLSKDEKKAAFEKMWRKQMMQRRREKMKAAGGQPVETG